MPAPQSLVGQPHLVSSHVWIGDVLIVPVQILAPPRQTTPSGKKPKNKNSEPSISPNSQCWLSCKQVSQRRSVWKLLVMAGIAVSYIYIYITKGNLYRLVAMQTEWRSPRLQTSREWALSLTTESPGLPHRPHGTLKQKEKSLWYIRGSWQQNILNSGPPFH